MVKSTSLDDISNELILRTHPKLKNQFKSKIPSYLILGAGVAVLSAIVLTACISAAFFFPLIFTALALFSAAVIYIHIQEIYHNKIIDDLTLKENAGGP